jgi:hypothetical protein
VRKTKIAKIPVNKIDSSEIGAEKASLDDGALPRCMTRHLTLGTGCAPSAQVLLLMRLPEEDGFGSCVAMGEMRRVKEGFGGPR